MEDEKTCCSDKEPKRDANGDKAKPVIFSVHYGDKKMPSRHGVTVSEKGEVDFSKWDPYSNGRNGDFDYGFLNPDGTVVSATHGHRSDENPGEVLVHENKEAWTRTADNWYEAWCVTCNRAQYGKHGEFNDFGFELP